MNCKNCKKRKLKKILDIGSQPISSVYYKKKQNKLKSYSLNLYKCQACDLVQFSKLAPLDDMYGTTYGYRTSLSKYMVDHMKKKYNFLIKSNYLKNKSSILDIGSNDGTFLNFFAKKGHKMDLFGIDPSSVKFKNFMIKKLI